MVLVYFTWGITDFINLTWGMADVGRSGVLVIYLISGNTDSFDNGKYRCIRFVMSLWGNSEKGAMVFI